jgi:hypothetical protein
MRSRIAGPALLTIALIALVGCSGSTGGSAAPSVSAAAPSTEASAPSAAPPSEAAPSSAPPSQAAASEPAASNPVPGYSFPSDDKELEALIPNTLCGAKAQKLSMKGNDVFNDASSADIKAALAAIGKSTDDVSAAAGFALDPTAGCAVIILRIKGVDEGQMRTVLLAEAKKEGQDYTETSLGGKTVYTSDPTKFDYTYIKGDGVIIITAKSKKDAESLISQLP